MTDLERKSHDLFSEAIEMSPSEWPAFLSAHCESAELRNRVQALLDAHMRSGNFLTKTAMEAYPKFAFPFGDQIDEFRIIRLIGKGGMGHVYLAEDTVLKRLIAIKLVSHSDSPSGTSEEIVDRFRREARAAARLVHPSIVQVYRTGEKKDFSYIAMEYVEGATLREKLETEMVSAQSDSSQRYSEVARLVSQIADALEHAHRAKVIHRDIKPSNILIDSEGKGRLADFGVARITTEETLQRTGSIVGSCAYMSPEQARVSKSEIDHRTDIFSLGVVLYEAICFRRPFEGSTFADILKALSDCSPRPLRKIAPRVPHDLSVICHKAMEKDVNDRYQSAAHFYADLRCFIEGRPILARPPSFGRHVRNWASKHKRVAQFGIVGGLAMAVAGLAVANLSAKRAQMGRLEVSDRHRGSVVLVERYSDKLKLESARNFGTAPVSTYLLPGLYRVTIEDSNSKLEAISLIEAGGIDFVEMSTPSEELVKSLVEIPAGQYQLGSTRSTYCLTSKRSVYLPAFRFSPTEVSNREYREFVIATRAAAPYFWPSPYDPAIDDLPVACISWDEANQYCRWRGVRMPTPDEWEAASKGPGGSTFPWGNEQRAEIFRNESAEFDATAYGKFALPVGSAPELATPLGIKHMMTNVQEYSAGVDVERNFGLIVKGRSWADSPLTTPVNISTLSGRDLRSFDRGFRIAVSND